MSRLVLLSTAILLACFSTTAPAQTTYYVDASRPDDSGDGLSESFAWKTIDKVNTQLDSGGIVAGDTVLFKRGEVWRERLEIDVAGQSASKITFSAYGGMALPNPLIMPTAQVGWWQQGVVTTTMGSSGIALIPGGFERFVNDVLPAGPTAAADWVVPWRENTGGSSTITADRDNAFRGNYAAKLNRPTSQDPKPLLRIVTGALEADTEYQFSFQAKTESGRSAKLDLEIRDDQASGPDYWLHSDDEWRTSRATYRTVENQSTYAPEQVDFKTRVGSGTIGLRFIINSGDGSVWVDEAIIADAVQPPATPPVIWAAAAQGMGSQPIEISGMLKDGVRISTNLSATATTLNDLEAAYVSGAGVFLYRDDSSPDLSDAEVGFRRHAIRVGSDAAHITIDGIDVKGPGGRHVTCSSPPITQVECVGGADSLIFIEPGINETGAQSITIRNINVSEGTGEGISAGTLDDDKDGSGNPAPNLIQNPTDLLYEDVLSFGHESTGLYIRGSGTIQRSQVFDIGRNTGDSGDRGGIGLQDGPIDVEENEVFDIGIGDENLDFAISAVNPKAQIRIMRNFIHDVNNGGIQINGAGASLGHIIDGNIVHKFGLTSYTTPAPTTGKFAAARISDSPGTQFLNNVLSNGGSNVDAYGLSLRGQSQNVKVANNIFFENTAADIKGDSTTKLTTPGDPPGPYVGWDSDTNLFWRDSFVGGWSWPGAGALDSLADWRDYWDQQVGDPQDVGSLAQDPFFLSATPNDARDFGLSLDSDAINKGQDLMSSIGIDYFGNERGSVDEDWEIGAFELGSVALDLYEFPIFSTTVGSADDIAADDDSYEELTEKLEVTTSSTKSRMYHAWVFNGLDVSKTKTLRVQAHRTPNSEGDDFVVLYKTAKADSYTVPNASLWITATLDTDTYLEYSIPSGGDGYVEVAIVDADATDGNVILDTVFVDHIEVLEDP